MGPRRGHLPHRLAARPGRPHLADAARLARASRRLLALPVTAAGYADGTLSGGQVRAVLANLTEATVAVFAGHEHELVPLLAPLSTTETVTAMRHWAASAADAQPDDGAPDDTADTEPRRGLYLSEVLDGRRVLDGDLDADSAAVLVTGRSSVLDYGTATRTFPVNLWNALVIRDRHCRFPGCDRSPPMCHGHHVVPFEQRGPTKLTNCVLLCHRHHRVIHRRGWTTELSAGGDLVVTDPHGVVRTSRPPPAAGGELPLSFAA